MTVVADTIVRVPGAGTSPHPALAALVDAELVDGPATLSAAVTDLSRAHSVWSVQLADGSAFVVKSNPAGSGPDLSIECLVYRMTVWCEALAAALPEPVVIDEDRGLIILRRSDDPTAGGSLAQQIGPPLTAPGAAGRSEGRVPPSPATFAELGRALGALHRATAGLPLPPARTPAILHPRGLAVGAGAVEGFHAAAREFEQPVAVCLVHHDLKWDNVITGPDRIVVVDWEMAGSGDPAWDLGCLVAEHLCRSDGRALGEAGAALLGGYRSGSGIHSDVVPAMARRVTAAAGLRVVGLALEYSQSFGPRAAPVESVLHRIAAQVFAHSAQLRREIETCWR